MEHLDKNQNPETDLEQELGDPVAVATCCRIETASAVIRCDACQTKCRINLLAETPSQCPQCGKMFSSALLLCEPHDVEAIADLLSAIDGEEEDDEDEEPIETTGEEVPDAIPTRNPEDDTTEDEQAAQDEHERPEK